MSEQATRIKQEAKAASKAVAAEAEATAEEISLNLLEGRPVRRKQAPRTLIAMVRGAIYAMVRIQFQIYLRASADYR